MFQEEKQYKRNAQNVFVNIPIILKRKKLEVATERQEELDSLNEMYCNVQQDIDMAMHFDRRLFESNQGG